MDTSGAWHRLEEREVVGRHVDRAAPRSLDARIRKPGQQAPQAVLGARRGRTVAGEARVELAAEADRPRAAPHQYAAVVRRAEVVQEHPCVDDRLAAGPPDLF